jgi:DNA-binding GntR family transcriptional regulator
MSLSIPNHAGRPGKRTASTVDQVVQQLKDAIRDGRLEPGRRLVQEELVEEFKVSRGPVREALRRLAADGIVELKFNSGASVRLFSRAEVLAIEEAREAVEGMSARLAAQRFAKAGRRVELDRLCEAMDQAAAEGAKRTFLTLNESFHDLIFAISGNDVLRHFASQLHTPLLVHQFRAFEGNDWMPLANAEHMAIAEALRRGDADKAETEMRAHLRRIREISEHLPESFFEPSSPKSLSGPQEPR